jgi:NTE family protein
MSTSKPKVAVVLGGGGIKPYSAIPLIAFLNQNNIPVDLLVGCSGGSIVVSLWASGYTTDQMLTEIAPRVKKSTFKPNWKAIKGVANLPTGCLDKESALVQSGPIRAFFRDLWGDQRLEDLKIKTIIQVTDFQTGEGIGLESGVLADCVYASSAIFPLLPAVKIGERWLFDGGYSAPVPILQAIKQNADIIIAVDFLEKMKADPKGIFDNLMHTGKLSAKTIAAMQMALSIDMHNAEIIYMKVEFDKQIAFWEIEKFPEILNAGEKALAKIKDDVLMVYKHASESGKQA